MNWFYVEAGQQRGPVSEEQLQDLARTGKVLPGTLVWREGMANWQAYSSLQAAELPAVSQAPPIIATGSPGTICAECGQTFPSTEVVRIHNTWICGGCKPVFVQRMLEGAPPPGAGIWCSNKDLVAAKGAPFPDRCVKCNAPVHGWRLKRNLYWYPSYVFILIILSLLIGAIVAMIVRKNAKFEIGLCELHRSKRIRNMVVGGLLTVGGFGLIIASATGVFKSGWSFVAAVGALICGIIFMTRASLIAAKRMDAQYVWIKGAGRPFLDSLPKWV